MRLPTNAHQNRPASAILTVARSARSALAPLGMLNELFTRLKRATFPNAHYNLLLNENKCRDLDYSPCVSPSGKTDLTKYILYRKRDVRTSMTAEAAAEAQDAEVAATAAEVWCRVDSVGSRGGSGGNGG